MCKGNSDPSHPIETFLRKVPIGYRYTVLFIGTLQYVIFLVLLMFCKNWFEVLTSPMHLLQLLFSITVIIGLFSLEKFMRDFRSKFEEIRGYFTFTDQEFETFVAMRLAEFCDTKALAFGFPFMIISSWTSFFYLMPTMPNSLYPVGASSFVWFYCSIMEFNIFMMSLLGIGIWIGIHVVNTYKDLKKKMVITINKFGPDFSNSLKPLSQLILRGTTMYSAIIATVFPFLSYTVYFLQRSYPSFLLYPVVGLVIVVTTILLYFIIPQYYIQSITSESKRKMLADISTKIKQCFKNLEKIEEKSTMSSHESPEEGPFLLMFYEQIEKMHTWPPYTSIIIKASVALISPLVTFMLTKLTI